MTTQKPVKKICKRCGKEFEGHNAMEYCSDKCRIEEREVSKAKTVACELCGNMFVTTHANSKQCPECKEAIIHKPKREEGYSAERAAETSARMAEVGFNYGEAKKKEYLAKLKAAEEARKEETAQNHIPDVAKMVEPEPAEEPVAPDTEEDAYDPKKELEKIWDFVSEQELDFDSGAAVILLCNGEYEMAMRHLKHKLKVMDNG